MDLGDLCTRFSWAWKSSLRGSVSGRLVKMRSGLSAFCVMRALPSFLGSAWPGFAMVAFERPEEATDEQGRRCSTALGLGLRRLPVSSGGVTPGSAGPLVGWAVKAFDLCGRGSSTL